MSDGTTMRVICARRVLVCVWWVSVCGFVGGPIETLWVYCFEFVNPVCFSFIEFIFNR